MSWELKKASMASKEVTIIDDEVLVAYTYQIIVKCPLLEHESDISLEICKQCGKPIFQDEVPRRDREYCSKACKSKAYRERKKLVNTKS